MSESLADRMFKKIEQATENYYRLVILAAPAGAGKTAAFQLVQKRTGAPLINVNLSLAEQLLELTERQRVLQAPKILANLIANARGEVALLDNIEILFDPTLKLDPLRLLQHLSRNKTLGVSWNGVIENGYLIYARSDHPEYKRYPAHDLVILTPGIKAT